MADLRPALNALRSRFGGLAETGHKQIGLRAIRTALQLLAGNPAEAERQYWRARFELPYAEASR